MAGQAEPAGPDERGRRVSSAAEWAWAVPVALGFLVYLGRTYTDAWFAHFELRTGGLGFSLVDYALYGARVVGPPIAILAMTALTVIAWYLSAVRYAHAPVDQEVNTRSERLRRVLRVVDEHIRGPKAHRLVPFGVIITAVGLASYVLVHHTWVHAWIPSHFVILFVGAGPLAAGLGLRVGGAGQRVLA
ncbi:hypothetical protein ACFQ07_08415, partial [Actinomadura adrarensis]